MALEVFAEDALGVVADEVGDFGEGVIVLGDELGGFFEAGDVDELFGGEGGEGFDFAVEGGAAHVHMGGEVVDVEVGVAEVFADVVVELFEKLFVGFGVGDDADVFEGGAGEVVFYFEAVFEEVGDLELEELGGEGFLDIGVGADFEAFDVGFVGIFGGEEDDGDVAVFDAGFDGVAELEAVDARHHYVADYEIDHLFFEDGEGGFTAGGEVGCIAIAQDVFQEFEHIGVVVDD